MNYLGEKIRLLRTEKNLLLRQMAAYLEVDTAHVSKLERGERRATREQVRKIAEFLNVGDYELLTLWMADKIEATIIEEPGVAYDALKIANKNLKKDERN